MPRQTLGKRNRNKNKTKGKKPRLQNAKDVPIFGRIHAKWCGHCKNMKSDWQQLKRKNKNKMICVDIEEQEQSKKIPRFNKFVNPSPALQFASGFPYVFRVVNQQLEEYNSSSRSFDDLQAWLNSPLSILKTTEDQTQENITIT